MNGPVASLEGLRVLVVDDEEDIRSGLRLLLSPTGAEVACAADGKEALVHLERAQVDLVLTDLMMPRMSGSELLSTVKERWPSTVVVVLTGFGTIQGAVSCLQMGAAHFMTKPFDNDEVLRLVERLGRAALGTRRARERVGTTLVAVDPAMRAVLELVERAASTAVPVLVEGPSGTGKELVARALHDRGPRAQRPFLAVNAAALPESLLESELFGHEQGAFTGAGAGKAGLFEQAAGGTVFLDEVASMTPACQGKLLRALQERKVRRVGGAAEEPVDFRLVAASNRDLEGLVHAGGFREDLFYRLAVVRIAVPPLAERPGDVEPLARHFLASAAGRCLDAAAPVPELGEGALEALRAHPWPGNVRELENAIQRAVVVCGGPLIQPHHLGLGGAEGGGAGESAELDYQAGKQLAIERFQREFVHRALESAGGNVSRAAERCGLTRAAFQRIMRQLDIDRRAFAEG